MIDVDEAHRLLFSLVAPGSVVTLPLDDALFRTLAIAGLVHLVMVLGESTLTHTTAHAKLATHEMLHGRFAAWFWSGAVLVALAVILAWTGSIVAAPAALFGLLAFEHAYVQAGQAVPLA